MFASDTRAVKTFLISFPTDYTDKRLLERKVGQKQKKTDIKSKVGDVGYGCFKEGLETCKYFIVEAEMKNERHRVFNFATDSHLFSKKLNLVFDSLNYAVGMKVAFGFVVKNVDDGSCRH